jgi:hypothetical protein
MAAATDTLSQRERSLEAEGADPLRLECLRRARRFKRSWIEMAEVLLQVRVARTYEEWGYDDLYQYCEQELLIKRRTVEKLTGSFTTIREHAPEILDEARQDAPLPTFDAVDYYKKVVDGAEMRGPRAAAKVEELRSAVFERAEPVSEIKKQFNPIFFAKTDEDVALEALMRVKNTAERLEKLLDDVDGILSGARIAAIGKALATLKSDLEELLPAAREAAETARAA